MREVSRYRVGNVQSIRFWIIHTVALEPSLGVGPLPLDEGVLAPGATVPLATLAPGASGPLAGGAGGPLPTLAPDSPPGPETH